MEVAAGAWMRPRLAQVGHAPRRCANGLQRNLSAPIYRIPLRSLHSAAGPGPGPSGDVGDALAPILFRFGDSPTSQTIGGKLSSSSSTSRSTILAGGTNSSTGTSGSGTAPNSSSSSSGISGLAPSTTVAGVAPLEAPPRTITGTSTSGSSSPSRLSHHDTTPKSGSDVVTPDTASTSGSSYSDYYRQKNTSFQRGHGASSSPILSVPSTAGPSLSAAAPNPTPASSPSTSMPPSESPSLANGFDHSLSATAAAPPATSTSIPGTPTSSDALSPPTPAPTPAATTTATATHTPTVPDPASTPSTSPIPSSKEPPSFDAAAATTSSPPTHPPTTPTSPSTPPPAPTPAPEVVAALARAQAALQRAETSLEDIQRLSSSLDQATLASLHAAATPPSKWTRLLALARSAAALGALSVALLASHAFGLAVQWVGAVAGAAAIAGWGLRSRALAPSGAAAAFLVGCGTLGSSLRFGATLVAFFLSSSKLTSYKEELKEGLEEGAKKGGQRTWVQVLCNGLVPTILAVVYGILAGCVDLPLGPPASATSAISTTTTAAVSTAAALLSNGPALEPWRAAALTALMGGFLGYYACCCGDTWASELGPLSADSPVLISSLRPVRRGTNGGVTLLGLSASIMGGMFVGLVFYLAGLLSPTLWIFESQRALAASQWRLIPLGLMAGLLGSCLDSLLGATMQFSGFHAASGRIVAAPGPGVERIAGVPLLSNNAVNAVSASATAALTAFVALKSFGF